jgi:hypothetical protein
LFRFNLRDVDTYYLDDNRAAADNPMKYKQNPVLWQPVGVWVTAILIMTAKER